MSSRVWCGALAAAVGLLAAGCGSTSASTSTKTVAGGGVTVRVTAPASGTVIDASNVTVRGTVDPPSAAVQVDGHPAAVGNGVFTASASVQSGKTTIDVIGSASGKAPGSTSIVITRPGAKKRPRPPSSSTITTTATQATATPPPSGGQSSCGGGLSVGPATSCAFAENVQGAYTGPGTYEVYSPVTGDTYSMTCNLSGAGVACTGGNNASVYFPS
jgi:hypothetical protein